MKRTEGEIRKEIASTEAHRDSVCMAIGAIYANKPDSTLLDKKADEYRKLEDKLLNLQKELKNNL
ncbi:MAG: hypothetical protein JWO58_149 [Chitinophagaceae bacterium]|nr:hypothetical protein [Chitinophagaceae bacterium]